MQEVMSRQGLYSLPHMGKVCVLFTTHACTPAHMYVTIDQTETAISITVEVVMGCARCRSGPQT